MKKFLAAVIRPHSPETLILLTVIFLTAADNRSFFAHLFEAYPFSAGALSVGLFYGSVLYFVLSLLTAGPFLKPALLLSLLVGSLASFANQKFGAVIDESMITNLLRTDRGEAFDLLTGELLVHLALTFALPALLLLATRVKAASLRRALARRTLGAGAALLTSFGVLFSFGSFYASFLREHKELRSYLNPIYPYYSAGKYAAAHLARAPLPFSHLGIDAKIAAADHKRDLVILVVGETARADHFSLNGYGPDTNPRLRRRGVISLENLRSCGTSTAISLPCMFSSLGHEAYDERRALATENVLDVLQHTGRISVLWRDNNSDSKGVALRVPYEDFKTPAKNPDCDEECRDEGMLSHLQEYIDQHPTGDLFIVLHQMGNHGPAYHKRYPKAFERFRPACATAELSNCTQEEIVNAYDNAILYTDYFLDRVIALLERNDAKFETGLLYISDHGESLGEHGVYLHGLPYRFAPEPQKRPAGLVWLGPATQRRVDLPRLRARAREPLSHDNLFHSILGLLEVETSSYRRELDLFAGGQASP